MAGPHKGLGPDPPGPAPASRAPGGKGPGVQSRLETTGLLKDPAVLGASAVEILQHGKSNQQPEVMFQFGIPLDLAIVGRGGHFVHGR